MLLVWRASGHAHEGSGCLPAPVISVEATSLLCWKPVLQACWSAEWGQVPRCFPEVPGSARGRGTCVGHVALWFPC